MKGSWPRGHNPMYKFGWLEGLSVCGYRDVKGEWDASGMRGFPQFLLWFVPISLPIWESSSTWPHICIHAIVFGDSGGEWVTVQRWERWWWKNHPSFKFGLLANLQSCPHDSSFFLFLFFFFLFERTHDNLLRNLIWESTHLCFSYFFSSCHAWMAY